MCRRWSDPIEVFDVTDVVPEVKRAVGVMPRYCNVPYRAWLGDSPPVSSLLGDQESFHRRQRDISARLLRRAPADDVASHPTLSHERHGCVIARIEMIGKNSSQVRSLGQ